jgi:hypothetical protein
MKNPQNIYLLFQASTLVSLLQAALSAKENATAFPPVPSRISRMIEALLRKGSPGALISLLRRA